MVFLRIQGSRTPMIIPEYSGDDNQSSPGYQPRLFCFATISRNHARNTLQYGGLFYANAIPFAPGHILPVRILYCLYCCCGLSKRMVYHGLKKSRTMWRSTRHSIAVGLVGTPPSAQQFLFSVCIEETDWVMGHKRG